MATKYDTQLGDLKTHLANAKNVLIALPQTLTVDKLASALSLMLAIKAQGKQVTVLTQDQPKVAHANLFGVGEVKSQLPQNSSGNFMITLEGVVQNGQVPSLDKLDWYPEGANLNLVFHTVPGQKFEPINITHKYQGSDPVNLIFVIGAPTLSDLGEIYPLNIQQFTGVPIINIDNSSANANFGYINAVDSMAGSISEMMAQILPGLNLPVDQDIASNLLAGIYDVTQNLTQNVKPETFLAVGYAMQAGGKIPSQAGVQSQFTPQSQLTPQPQPAVQTQPQPQTPQGFDLRQVFQTPPQPISPTESFTNPQVATQSTQETPVREAAQTQSTETAENPNPAPDWLTPKIYKGGSLG